MATETIFSRKIAVQLPMARCSRQLQKARVLRRSGRRRTKVRRFHWDHVRGAIVSAIDWLFKEEGLEPER